MNALALQLDEAFAAFRAAVDGADLERPTPAGWTAKEMVAHVAFWLECVDHVVETMQRGRTDVELAPFGSGYVPGDTWPDADAHNEREAAWARTQAPGAVVERLDRAHVRARAVLATVTPDEQVAHGRYYDEVVAHLVEHRAELAERPDPAAPVASDP